MKANSYLAESIDSFFKGKVGNKLYWKLHGFGKSTMGELLEIPPVEFLKTEGIGRGSMKLLLEIFKNYGIVTEAWLTFMDEPKEYCKTCGHRINNIKREVGTGLGAEILKKIERKNARYR